MNFQRWREEAKVLLPDFQKTLITYLRHPIEQISHLPDWPWRKLILFQGVVTAGCGFLKGFFEKNILFGTFSWLFLMPILTLISAMVASAFLYYLFQVFEKRTVSYRSLFTLVAFANIPSLFFQIIATYLPPITLVGFAFTALLLVTGLSQRFSMDRKRALQIVLSLYFVFFFVWALGKLDSLDKFSHKNDYDAPEVRLGPPTE